MARPGTRLPDTHPHDTDRQWPLGSRNLGAAQAAVTFNRASLPTCYGKEFTDRLFGLRRRAATGSHEFDQLCGDLSIEHRLPPPQHPQANVMAERFNGRIEDVLQSHHFRSGEALETTLHRYVLNYNQQLPQSVLGIKTPLQTMKDWHTLKPDLFRKQPNYLTGYDISKASHGHGDRTCQQNGRWPLCYAAETRRLPEPGGDDGIGTLRFPFRPGASGV